MTAHAAKYQLLHRDQGWCRAPKTEGIRVDFSPSEDGVNPRGFGITFGYRL